MILAILIIVSLILLVCIYGILVNSDGFTLTNRNIDALKAKVDILNKNADQVIAKHKLMTVAIEEARG